MHVRVLYLRNKKQTNRHTDRHTDRQIPLCLSAQSRNLRCRQRKEVQKYFLVLRSISWQRLLIRNKGNRINKIILQKHFSDEHPKGKNIINVRYSNTQIQIQTQT